MKANIKNIEFDGNIKMTSLDIAEITGKQHKNILADIRQEFEKIKDIAGLIFQPSEYKDLTGRKLPCYEFGKKGAMQLALKYDAVTRYKVIEKIEELEKRQASKYDIPYTFSEALRLAANQQEVIEKQRMLLAEAKPKIDYVDKILKSKALLSVSQIAKDYGLTGQKLNKILHENKVQYKQSGQWLLYNSVANKGYTQSETIEFTDKTGNLQVKLNTKWTIKGRLFIHDLLGKLDIKPNLEKDFETEKEVEIEEQVN